MQLLFDSSEEGDVACLGLLPGRVRRFAGRADLPVPHMGWNQLEFDRSVAAAERYRGRRLRLLRAQLCRARERLSRSPRPAMASRSRPSCSAATSTARSFIRNARRVSVRSCCAISCGCNDDSASISWNSFPPSISRKAAACVCFKGDFAAETVYSNEPAAVLDRYLSLGARRVHVVDLDGARDGEPAESRDHRATGRATPRTPAGRRRTANVGASHGICSMRESNVR